MTNKIFPSNKTMSALQRQTYANATAPLFVTTRGDSEIQGSLYIDNALVTQGTVGSVGVLLKNQQYISLTTEPDSPIREALRIYGGTSAPGVSYAYLSVQPGSPLYFGRQGVSAGSYITPGPSVAAASDQLVINGSVTSAKLNLGAQSCGTGTITVGQTNVVINSTLVTATSKIFLSHTGSPSAGPGAGAPQGNLTVNAAQIVPGVSFRVDLTDIDGISIAASNADATFNWLIVN